MNKFTIFFKPPFNYLNIYSNVMLILVLVGFRKKKKKREKGISNQSNIFWTLGHDVMSEYKPHVVNLMVAKPTPLNVVLKRYCGKMLSRNINF